MINGSTSLLRRAPDSALLRQTLCLGSLAKPELPRDRYANRAIPDRLRQLPQPSRIRLRHESFDPDVLSLGRLRLPQHRPEYSTDFQLQDQFPNYVVIDRVRNRVELRQRFNFAIIVDRNNLVGAQRLGLVLLVRANPGDDARSLLLCYIDRRAAHASKRSGYQHGIARLQLNMLDQLRPCSRNQRQNSRLFQVEPFGNQRKRIGLGGQNSA